MNSASNGVDPQSDASSPSSSAGALDEVLQHPQLPYTLPSLAHLDEYSRGTFHLLPCTGGEYFELPASSEDRYDLVEGILVWRDDMPPDVEHDCTRDGVAELLRSGIRDMALRHLVVHVERSISTSPPGESVGGKRSVRTPDIIVYQELSAAERSQRSPTSQKLTAPKGHPPKLAVEVTSTGNSRLRDLEVKKREYERAGVEEYMIIDRDLPSKSNPRVIMCREHNGRYSWTEYTENQRVACLYLRQHDSAASRLLAPPKPETTAGSPVRRAEREQKEEERKRKEAEKRMKEEEKKRKEEEKKRKEEEKKRKEEEKKRKEEEKKRKEEEKKRKEEEKRRKEVEKENDDLRRRLEKEKNKHDRTRAKSKKRKTEMKKSGVPVSDSSSASNSPRRKGSGS